MVDKDHDVVNEVWHLSDRPTYCSSCGWKGAMKDVKFLEGECFPFRCPKCGAWVVNRKGEE